VPRKKSADFSTIPLTSEPAGSSPDVQTPAFSPPETGVVAHQPWLLDEDLLPHRPDLVLRAKEFVHTGKITDQNDALVQSIVDALGLGQSIRQISRDNDVSRNTVARIRDDLTESGKLEPYKQRASRKLGRLIEATLDNLIKKAEHGTLPANVEGIVMGIGIDKKGQLDGNVVPGTNLPEPGLTAADIEREILEMKRATVVEVQTVEKESVAQPAKPQ
jgi:hypothetical protein